MARRATRRKPAAAEYFKIQSTDDVWTHLSMMVYGGFGVGKTWFAGTSAQQKELGPVLLVDCDGGGRTLRGKPQFKGIKIVRMLDFRGFNKVYEMLDGNPNAFGTVILDNLNEIHNMAMALQMQEVVKKDPTREVEVPSQREYGIVRAQIRKLIMYFNNLEVNLIVTCHADLHKDDVDGRIYIRPAVAGKLHYEIPGLLGIVGYLTADRPSAVKARKGGDEAEIVRTMHFQPHGRIDAKDQSDALGFSIENPTVPQIAKLIGII
jgi:phage nucleotide-binding protein